MNIESVNKMSPTRKLILGFLFAIIIGSILLKMPFSIKEGIKISYLSSLFTIVSAICVTGLSVVDIPETFSLTGQYIILFFIQIGGLGVMTFSSLIFLLAGKRMNFYERELLKEERNAFTMGELSSFVRFLVSIVFLIESIGAIILTYEFSKIMEFKKALFYATFHSISAFCNAGISIFPHGMEDFTSNVLVNFTVAYLIIIGGIGFAVINSFLMVVRRKVERFTLTSKLAITVSVILTFVVMVFIFLLEYTNTSTLGEMGFVQKIMTSFFQSVTLRTAGFTVIPLDNLRKPTIFISSIAMFIGASPGSTGGGIKTTTFGVIVFYIIGVVRKKDSIEIFNRRLDWEIINKALAILVISLFYICTVITLILIFDDFESNKVVYEVVSAFSTTGSSLGITNKLNIISRILIIITMFVGRLGPLTFALALGEENKKSRIRYPKEDILIG